MKASPRVLLVDDEQEFVDALAKRLRARELGAFEVLSKPTEITRLTEILSAAFARAVERAE